MGLKAFAPLLALIVSAGLQTVVSNRLTKRAMEALLETDVAAEATGVAQDTVADEKVEEGHATKVPGGAKDEGGKSLFSMRHKSLGQGPIFQAANGPENTIYKHGRSLFSMGLKSPDRGPILKSLHQTAEASEGARDKGGRSLFNMRPILKSLQEAAEEGAYDEGVEEKLQEAAQAAADAEAHVEKAATKTVKNVKAAIALAAAKSLNDARRRAEAAHEVAEQAQTRLTAAYAAAKTEPTGQEATRAAVAARREAKEAREEVWAAEEALEFWKLRCAAMPELNSSN